MKMSTLPGISNKKNKKNKTCLQVQKYTMTLHNTYSVFNHSFANIYEVCTSVFTEFKKKFKQGKIKKKKDN